VGTRDRGLYRSIAPVTLATLDASASEPVPMDAIDGEGAFGREIVAATFEPVWSRQLGAPTNQIETALWHDGGLWVGTPVGLFLFQGTPPRVVKNFTREDGLDALNATSMAFSPSGFLWLGTNAGLAEIDPWKRTVSRSVTRQDPFGNGGLRLGRRRRRKGRVLRHHGHRSTQRDVPQLDATAVATARTALRAEPPRQNEFAVEYAHCYARSRAFAIAPRWGTTAIGARNAAEKTRYTNLPAFFLPRTYTSNSREQWRQRGANTAALYSFPVMPCGSGGGRRRPARVVGGALVVYRTRTRNSRAAPLEHMVGVRTQRERAKTLQRKTSS
jgi:hypothetical protein